MFVYPRSEVRLGPAPWARSGGPPPQVKSEESESDSKPSPLELDLALALTPPPAVHRQTGLGRRSRRIRAPSPVSVDDPRVLLPSRQQPRRQPRRRQETEAERRSQHQLRQALLRGEVPMGFGADESEIGRQQRQRGRQQRQRGANAIGYGQNWASILGAEH